MPEARPSPARIAGLLSVLAIVSTLLVVPSVAGATFPGANGKIAFTALIPDPLNVCSSFYSRQIFVVDPDGTGESNLSNVPHDDYPASWSPSGQRLAFARSLPVGDCHGNSDVFVMNADGGGQRDLTGELFRRFDCGYACSEGGPSWSPNEDKLAFGGDTDYGFSAYTIGLDGSGLTSLGPDCYDSSSPVWSPNGQKIAFGVLPSLYRCGGGPGGPGEDIYVANPDNSGLVRLTNDPTGYNTPLSWSPDGTRIAFARSTNTGPPYTQTFYAINADGTGRTELPGYAAWSPNGQWLAYANSEGIFVMDAYGPNVIKLTTEYATPDSRDPVFVWSPDSRKIAFIKFDPDRGAFDLETINVDGTGLTKLVDDVYSVEDWQPLPPSAFKNSAKFCGALRASMGESSFKARYGNFGHCVKRSHAR